MPVTGSMLTRPRRRMGPRPLTSETVSDFRCAGFPFQVLSRMRRHGGVWRYAIRRLPRRGRLNGEAKSAEVERGLM